LTPLVPNLQATWSNGTSRYRLGAQSDLYHHHGDFRGRFSHFCSKRRKETADEGVESGIAALLTVVCLSDFRKKDAKLKWHHKANFLILQLSGWYFLISSALIYYTHVGLIVSTMK
jgi:hypothetical protein